MCASGSLFTTGKTIDRREVSLCGSVLAWGRGYMVKVKLLLLSSNAAFLGFFGCCYLFFFFFHVAQGDDSPSPMDSGIFTKVFLSADSC